MKVFFPCLRTVIVFVPHWQPLSFESFCIFNLCPGVYSDLLDTFVGKVIISPPVSIPVHPCNSFLEGIITNCPCSLEVTGSKITESQVIYNKTLAEDATHPSVFVYLYVLLTGEQSRELFYGSSLGQSS